MIIRVENAYKEYIQNGKENKMKTAREIEEKIYLLRNQLETVEKMGAKYTPSAYKNQIKMLLWVLD